MKKYIFLGFLIAGLFYSCEKEHSNKDEKWDGDKIKHNGGKRGGEACFTMVYPITFIMPDRSTITGNSREELGAAIKRFYEAHPDFAKKHVMQYPVEIIFRGETKTINNQREMVRVREACTGIRSGDRDKAPCLEMSYPLTYIMPDKSTVTGNNKKEIAALLKRWHEAHPDAKSRPMLQYPINAKFKGRPITIHNKEEMNRLRKACAGDKDRDKEPCFKLVYPISYIMPDRSKLTGNNEKEIAMAIRKWFMEHPDFVREKPSMVFPVKLKFKDGSILRVKNERELKRAYDDCDD